MRVAVVVLLGTLAGGFAGAVVSYAAWVLLWGPYGGPK